MAYRDPKPKELKDPIFNAIWDIIKTWDVNVPDQYGGYCGCTGNHVCAIMDAVKLSAADCEHHFRNNGICAACGN